MKKKTQHITQAGEPAVAYGMETHSPLSVIMGGLLSPPTDFDLVEVAREGIAKKNLLSLARRLSLTIQEIADILHISERTLQRYRDDTFIRTEHADRAIELAKLYERGIEVLGTAEAFDNWLRHPSYALRDEVPLDLLDTSIGFTMVQDELGRIEHGILS